MQRRTKLIIGATAIAATAALGAGVAMAGGGDDDATDRPIPGEARVKAEAAALAFTGGGRVTGTEVGDEESLYEVEVTKAGGGEVDVQLDENFRVVGQQGDDGEQDEGDER